MIVIKETKNMNIEIRVLSSGRVRNCYRVYVDGKFHSAYRTNAEAVKKAEALKQ